MKKILSGILLISLALSSSNTSAINWKTIAKGAAVVGAGSILLSASTFLARRNQEYCNFCHRWKYKAKTSPYNLEDGWPENAKVCEIVDLFKNIDTKKFTPEKLESLYNRFFENFIEQMTQNTKLDYILHYYQFSKILTMVIKDHEAIREKFLGLLPTLRFRTDNWGELGACLTIFKDLIDGLLDDQCICQRKIIDMAEANLFTANKEINSLVTGSVLEKYPDLASQNLHNRFFDEAIKQMTQNYEEYDHLKDFLQTNARTVTVLTNAIKSHKTILEKFLELLPTFHCRTDRWNYNSVDIFKRVINKLLDDPYIRPKIIDVAQKTEILSIPLL